MADAAGRNIAQRRSVRYDFWNWNRMARRRRERRQVGKVGGDVTHLLVGKVGERRHGRVDALTCMEIDEFLIDRAWELAGEIGRVSAADAGGPVADRAALCE